jgi:phosphate transport system protein
VGDAVEIEGHTSRSFDDELGSLHVAVVEMGGLVLLQVRVAASAYAEWHAALADEVLEREGQINESNALIEARSLRLIAKRQPVAGDLRIVVALTRVVAELERAGDESKKIALAVLDRPGRNAERPGPATVRDASHLTRLALDMMRLALQALDELDAGVARRVVQLDAELDEEYRSGLRRLISRAMEDPRQFSAAIQAAFVLKALERIGDHARNVARLVVRMTQSAERS